MKTAILIPDKEKSAEVQRTLFFGGVVWVDGKKEVKTHNISILFVDINGRYITWDGGDSLYDAILRVEKEDYTIITTGKFLKDPTIITADKFLADPTIIPCWKKPEPKMIEVKGKKYSEDTLDEAMKQYVNSR